MRYQGAFTLIEIMIVVIIIGVLAGIAVPLYSKTVERARISEAVGVLGSIRDAEIRYALEYGNYSPGGDLTALDIQVNTSGKFFSFNTYGKGAPDNPDPLDYVYERIACAVRNSLDAGVFTGGSCTDYCITISENGTLASDCTPVNNIFN